MGTSRRRTFEYALVTALIFFAIVALGVKAMIDGTAVAQVDPSVGHAAEIEIYVDRHSDVKVNLYWTLGSGGEVKMTINTNDGDEVTNDSTAYVYLRCGARMEELEVGEIPSYDNVTVAEGGSEEACNVAPDPSQVGPDQRAYQKLSVVGLLEDYVGTPTGRWTDTRAGQRVARTPVADMGRYQDDLVPASPMSTVETALTGAADESMTTASPIGISGGEVRYQSEDVDRAAGITPQVSAVAWVTSAAGENAPQPHNLASGNARWILPHGQQESQMLLVLAGVLLGVAASALVEIFIALTRASGAREEVGWATDQRSATEPTARATKQKGKESKV